MNKLTIAENDTFAALQSELTSVEIKQVYTLLKSRSKNPPGSFDKQGRFYSTNADIMSVRSPSAGFPYSQMTHARTLKHIKTLVEARGIKTLAELEKVAFA